ncbi:MAG: hypothetical protein H6R21_1339 [Proteobacteria bacterium]|nr:hypothetical protein [Pseudomonadota bacterium]
MRLRGWKQHFVLICAMALAACAETPQRYSNADAFRDTKRLETQLKKGVSTMDDVKRVLGEPSGSGAVFLASVQQSPQEIWFYQDIELTDIKASQGQLDLKMRQQILVVFVRNRVFDGFMWFSNAEAATGWVKDSLRGKVGQ